MLLILMLSNSLKYMKIKKVSIRTRCRVCGRYRYIRFLRPSITEQGKWFCSDFVDCIAYKKYKNEKVCII